MQDSVSFKEVAYLVSIGLVIGGIALGSNGLLTLGLVAAALFLTSRIWHRLAFYRLEYRRTFSETRAFVGETLTFTITVTNRKWLPLTWLRLTDNLSAQLQFTDLAVSNASLPGLLQFRQYFMLSWFEQVSRTLETLAAA